MKGITKCLLFVLSFVLLSTGLSALYSTNANAWAGATPLSTYAELSELEEYLEAKLAGTPYADFRNMDYVIGDFNGQFSISIDSPRAVGASGSRLRIEDNGPGSSYVYGDFCRFNRSLGMTSFLCNTLQIDHLNDGYPFTVIHYIHLSDMTYNQWSGNGKLDALPESLRSLMPQEQKPKSNAQPDIFMSSMVKWKGEFSDRNFMTFDGNPFLCGEFAPQINVEIFDITNEETFRHSLSTSASSQFYYTFPTSPDTTKYRIVSWYSCPEIDFNNVAFYDFEINSTGGLVTPIPCNAEYFCSLNVPTHGLTQAIITPLTFIAQIPTLECTPLALPMPHNMQNISLPCMTPIYQQYFPGILLLFQTILTGMFSYYVSIKLFGGVKEVTNPRDDQVETVKL